MLRRSGRSSKAKLAGILFLALSCSGALAQDSIESAPANGGTYVSIFGGAGTSKINSVTQLGNALFPPNQGGPLDVNATGASGNRNFGLVGLQIGREWSSCSNPGCWSLVPATELEAFYFSGTQRALVQNPNIRLPEHDFDNSFPMDNFGFMTNFVLRLRTPSDRLSPYIGAGVGAAAISIHGADSPQVNPPETGVNHFNSNPNATSWGFAAQGKIGLRFQLTERAFIFTEYRLMYVGSTNYVFGSTQYPTHAPTTPWTVRFGDMWNQFGVAGIGFNF